LTPDCRRGACTGCGACASLDAQLEIAHAGHPFAQPDRLGCGDDAGEPLRYRIGYTKTGPARFLSHLELTRVFARALRRAGLPLKFSGGFHPMPRITFHTALPVGLESEEEFCDVLLRELPTARMLEGCLRQFPAGISILGIEPIALKNKAVPARMRSYRVRLPAGAAADLQRTRALLEQFSARAERPFEMQSKKGPHTLDLKQIVRGLSLSDDGLLELHIDPVAARVPRINDIVGEIFELTAEERAALAVMKLRAHIPPGAAACAAAHGR
jgi:radical SAM-linked protein